MIYGPAPLPLPVMARNLAGLPNGGPAISPTISRKSERIIRELFERYVVQRGNT